MALFLCIHFGYSQSGRPNGWYHLDDAERIVGDPIITVADFAYLRIDSGVVTSDEKIFYNIIGQVKEDKIKNWGDETENAIGKKIGFLYNGKVLCAPSPNVRLPYGHFGISIDPVSAKEDANTIFKELQKELYQNQDTHSPLTSEEMGRFDSLYTAWKGNYLTSPITRFSSNTNDAKKLEQYPELMSMGKRALPLVITRLPVRSDFFALTLYNDLQDDDNLKCLESGSEQHRVQMTLKKYIEAKTGKKKREFTSDTAKIKALTELCQAYGWENDPSYTIAQRDSMLLDMDYEITEEFFKLFIPN